MEVGIAPFYGKPMPRLNLVSWNINGLRALHSMGYSGVGIHSRHAPDHCPVGLRVELPDIPGQKPADLGPAEAQLLEDALLHVLHVAGSEEDAELLVALL